MYQKIYQYIHMIVPINEITISTLYSTCSTGTSTEYLDFFPTQPLPSLLLD